MPRPLTVAVVGLGGFAAEHHRTLHQLEREGSVKVLAACDPRADLHAALQAECQFSQRGVKVFIDLPMLLDALRASLDYVVIATPITLHAEMHAAVTAVGVPVYLEKPPTLDPAELEAMIVADRRAPRQALVAFNFIVEADRQRLKSRLLAGEFGKLQAVSLRAVGPRPEAYFKRNDWAGRLRVGKRWVLDSCFGNAMAHYVHDALFWAGPVEVFSWAQLSAVRARLYRAHRIEGADTFLVEATTATGTSLRVAATHAGSGSGSIVETVVCERATLMYTVGQGFAVDWENGTRERFDAKGFDGLRENHLAYQAYLLGHAPRPATSLVESRSFVALNALAYISSGRISSLPARLTSPGSTANGAAFLHVDALDEVFSRFLSDGCWATTETWEETPGEWVGLDALDRLPAVAAGLVRATKKDP